MLQSANTALLAAGMQANRAVPKRFTMRRAGVMTASKKAATVFVLMTVATQFQAARAILAKRSATRSLAIRALLSAPIPQQVQGRASSSGSCQLAHYATCTALQATASTKSWTTSFFFERAMFLRRRRR